MVFNKTYFANDRVNLRDPFLSKKQRSMMSKSLAINPYQDKPLGDCF